MKKLILHIGLSKCASSAIQTWCSRNSDALARSGIHYADLSPHAKYGQISSGNGKRLYSACLSGKTIRIEQALKHYYISQHPISLISAEQLQHLPFQKIVLLKEFCDINSIECKIIAYVRSAYEKAYSTYIQNVKRHGATYEFGEDGPISLQNDRDYLFSWNDVWGDSLRVINYDVVKQDVFRSFAIILGLDPNRFENDVGIVNRSLTFSESRLLLALNRLHGGAFSSSISDHLILQAPDLKSDVYYADSLVERAIEEAAESVNAINSRFFYSKTAVPLEVYDQSRRDNSPASEISEADVSKVVDWCFIPHKFKGNKVRTFGRFLRSFGAFLKASNPVVSSKLIKRSRQVMPLESFIRDTVGFLSQTHK